MTKAIILAAGRGSRMGNETVNKPKCLINLYGKTLLQWQIEALKKANIHEIELVVGYKSDNLLKYSKKTYLNSDWENTNMVSSLFCVPEIKCDTIISYSDIVYDFNHIIKLDSSKSDITITADLDWYKLWSERFENPLDDAETFLSENNILKSIGLKSNNINDIQSQFMGLIKLTQNGWKLLFDTFKEFSIKDQKSMDMTKLLNHLINKNIEINIVFVEGKWCECDSYDDVLLYEKLINKDNWEHKWF